MRIPRGTRLSLLVGVLASALSVLWLWNDYRHELKMHEQMLIVRGEGVLSALEAGIKSHRQLERWFRSNIDSVLEETAKANGIVGVAILTEKGDRLATGGAIPENFPLPDRSKWVKEGLLVGYKARLASSFSEGEGGRAIPGGWRHGALVEPTEKRLENDVWFITLVDGSGFLTAESRDLKRFYFSVVIALGAIFLLLVAVGLRKQQSDMAAELILASERENRLEELNLLAAGLAHETKNPLSLIRGMAQTCLNKSPDPEETQRIARTIVDESDRVEGRINSFLSYSRPIDPDLRSVDLAAVIAQTTQLFQDEATSRGIGLETSLDPLSVSADHEMVRQVLVNLLSNALSACDSGDSVRVDLRSEGGEITLSIRDTGQGISSKDLSQVLKPYFTRRNGGIGLGLSIVEQLTKAQGWNMKIDSEVGEGTLVSIRGLKQSTQQ